ALKPIAPREVPGSVDRERPILLPPAPHRVEVLEPEAQGIHRLVADGAVGIGPVLLHALPQRARERGLRTLLEVGDARGWRRGRLAEDLLEHPLAALHG